MCLLCMLSVSVYVSQCVCLLCMLSVSVYVNQCVFVVYVKCECVC